jgi:hypothetical protein
MNAAPHVCQFAPTRGAPLTLLSLTANIEWRRADQDLADHGAINSTAFSGRKCNNGTDGLKGLRAGVGSVLSSPSHLAALTKFVPYEHTSCRHTLRLLESHSFVLGVCAHCCEPGPFGLRCLSRAER